jgi:hypothetical protein
MTKDYEIYEKNIGCKEKLVFAIYIAYKPLIEKLSKRYAFNSGGRIEAEDFQSEVYLRLYYYANYIKKEKINPDTFMFYAYVKYAIFSVLGRNKKININELLLIDNEEAQNLYAAPEQFTPFSMDLNKFYSKLTKRQLKVIKDRQHGIHENETRKILKISHGTYQGCIDRTKELAKEFF